MKRWWAIGVVIHWLMGLTVVGQPNQRTTVRVLDSLDNLQPTQQIAALTTLARQWPVAERDTTYIRLVVDVARAHALSEPPNVNRSIHLLTQLIGQVQQKQVRSHARSDQLLKAYYRLMFCQLKSGRMAEARRTGEQGLSLARQHPRSKWASNLYSTLAYLRSTEGDYEQAALLAEWGALIGRNAGEEYCIANGYYEQAKALRKLERWSSAHTAIGQAIEVGKQMPIPNDLPLYYAVKASLFQAEKKYEEAEAWFQKTIALNGQRKDTLTLASNYNDLGYFYSVTRQYNRAVQTLNQALQLKSAASDRAVALDNLGMVYQKTGRTPQALQTFQQALHELMPTYTPNRPDQLPDSALSRRAPNKEFVLPILENLADTWLRAGVRVGSIADLRNALRTFAVADQFVDYMRWEQTGQQSKLYWREKTRRLYEGAIEACYRLHDPAMAFRFMEKSRAVLLTDKLNELGARQQLPPALAEQEQSLAQCITTLRDRLASTEVGTAAYRSLQAQLVAAQEKSDNLVRQMAQTHPLYYRYRYDNAIRPLAEIKAWLQTHDQSLVSYFVGDSALYVLGVTPAGTRLLRQPIAAYNRAVVSWLGLLHDPATLNSHFPDFIRKGQALYALLLGPLQLPSGRVVVSPDGIFLPLEALSRSATHPDYLVGHQAFSYVYSVNRLVGEPAKTSSQAAFLGMAPEQFTRTGGLASLLGSAESLRRVGSHFFLPTLLTGEAATRSSFRRLAPKADVVQLFTHADADTLWREPVLYFADSLLHLSELQTGPPFQTQLLVLSACRTGVGSIQKGEGVFSLARGFAALGVPSILTTLWSVENTPTYSLTERFYEDLAAGLPKDIALQRAKQQWLRTASRSGQLPTAWAGLILVGDSEPLQAYTLRTATMAQWGSVGLTSLVLGVILIRWRRRIRQRLVGQAGNWKPSLN